MATPAYFFIGVGKNARNVGLRYSDGYPKAVMPSLKRAHTASAFRRVAENLSDDSFNQGGVTSWDDANYEYVYALDRGRIRVFAGNDTDGKREIKVDSKYRESDLAPASQRYVSARGVPVTGQEWSTLEKVALGVSVVLGVYVLYKVASPTVPTV